VPLYSIGHHCNDGRDIGHLAWPLLGLIAAALTAVIALEVGLAADNQSNVSVPAPQSVAVAVAAPREGHHSPHSVETVLARPLFSRPRRPPAALANLVAVALRLPRLTGVVVSPAGGFAIFGNVDGGKPIVVGKGGTVGEAIIETVAAGQVTLRGPAGVVVLHTSFDEKVLQASRASLTRRHGGHDAAVLNR